MVYNFVAKEPELILITLSFHYYYYRHYYITYHIFAAAKKNLAVTDLKTVAIWEHLR
jgi:hypothetical protein